MNEDEYKIIAPIYKQLMSHVDYPMWANYLVDCIHKTDHLPGKALELAGGTGELAEHLKGQFQQIIGSDLRHGMTQQQSSEFFDGLVTMDMTQIPFQTGYFDTVFCLYDSVNYLLDMSSLDQYFSETSRVLQVKGLLIFDIVTEVNSLSYFHETLDYEEFTQGDLVRESFYDENNSMQYTKFIYYRHQEANRYLKLEEEHKQRIWTQDEIKQSLTRSGYEILAQYDGFGFESPTKETERIHWVLRKMG